MSDIDERLELSSRNVAELLTKDELAKLLSEKKRPSMYWGRAITGPLHTGHMVSMGKILDLQKAGFDTTILLADIHAALDDLKCKWEDLEIRREYTKKAIEMAMDWHEKPKFVVGSDYQLGKDYQMDIFRMSTTITVSGAMHAASEVTRMKNPKVSELIYPIMQALDEQYLGVDMQLGGLDQRHIMVMAREYLPAIGYRKNVEMMMPLITSMKGPGVKMSSSIPGSYIKVNASEEEIRSIIKDAYCPVGEVAGNPIIEIAGMFILPNEGSFTIERDAKFGGDITFNSRRELDTAFSSKKLHPLDLKNFVADYMVKRLKRARDYFEKNQDLLKQLGPQFM